MQTKWRIDWLESERGWGQSYWFTDYDTQEEAEEAYKRAKDEAGNNLYTPDFYIIPRDWKEPYQIKIDDDGTVYIKQT